MARNWKNRFSCQLWSLRVPERGRSVHPVRIAHHSLTRSRGDGRASAPALDAMVSHGWHGFYGYPTDTAAPLQPYAAPEPHPMHLCYPCYLCENLRARKPRRSLRLPERGRPVRHRRHRRGDDIDEPCTKGRRGVGALFFKIAPSSLCVPTGSLSLGTPRGCGP